MINWSRVAPADLPGDLREISEACGMDVVKTLVERFGGVRVYIPALQDIERRHLRQGVQEALGTQVEDGDICRRFRITRRQLQDIKRELRSHGVPRASN